MDANRGGSVPRRYNSEELFRVLGIFGWLITFCRAAGDCDQAWRSGHPRPLAQRNWDRRGKRPSEMTFLGGDIPDRHQPLLFAVPPAILPHARTRTPAAPPTARTHSVGRVCFISPRGRTATVSARANITRPTHPTPGLPPFLRRRSRESFFDFEFASCSCRCYLVTSPGPHACMVCSSLALVTSW